MDPNATLEEIREAVRHTIFDKEASDELVTLCAAIDALDKWITRGGFLPKDWKHE